MAQFSFRQDVEVIGVRTAFYMVEAETEEEAKKKIAKYADKDMMCEGDLSGEGITFSNYEYVNEHDRYTYEGITGLEPEIDTYDKDGNVITGGTI